MAYNFDPDSKQFLDPKAVDTELRRVFDVCHDCRRCHNLCPSFNTLLDGIDRAMEGKDAAGEVSSLLEKKTVDTVVDQCFQCKLCVPHCPYTPPHRWQIDFPRLMLRGKVTRAAAEGVRFRDRLLGNPALLGRLGSTLPGVANGANRNRIFRWAMEKTLGIDRRRRLPDYARRFSRWFRRQT